MSKTVTDGSSVTTSQVTNTYDLQGRLETVTTSTFTAGNLSRRERVTFDYNAMGIRVSSMLEVDADGDDVYETTTTTTFLNDSQNHTGYSQVLREVTVDDQGTEIKRIEYTIGHDQIAQTVYDAANPSGITHIFHTDGHGSTRVLTDLAATVLQQ